MSTALNQTLLEALLDSWDRNNNILLNLLRAIPESALDWHEGYHHGQIKLTLKLAGRSIPNKEAGPLTWAIWMRKK